MNYTSSLRFGFITRLICLTTLLRAQALPCPADWRTGPSKDKCFKYVWSSLSWNKSQSLCHNYASHLATLASAEELAFVQTLCTDRSGCWVGGRCYNSSHGLSWKWADNASYWNTSVLPRSQLRDTSGTSVNSCLLLTNSHVALASEKCDKSHGFICMQNTVNKCFNKHCHEDYIIILATVSGIILVTTLSVVIWLLVYRRSKKRRRSRKSSSPSSAALVPPSWKIYTSEELRSYTKNFSEGNRLMGDAKTGGAYTGILPDETRVVVKRLKRSSLQRKKEFFSEVGRVAKLHHDNLVAVKGCCYNHGDRYIVYEFVANGPLDRWLYHIQIRGGRSFDWAMRMRVATTLAQGIAFLHDKVKPQVVHRDIRASNVLIDEEFRAHLMGVGLSKFVPWEVMHERTVMAGTHGYLAPEFVYRNELTTKSDVYSFGVLLLEIISGRRPAQAIESVGWQTIFEWATPLVQSHRYIELLDPYIVDVPEAGVVQKVVDLVYSCTQHVPSVRPRMSHVVHQLQQLGLKAAASGTSSNRASTSSASPIMHPLELETVQQL